MASSRVEGSFLLLTTVIVGWCAKTGCGGSLTSALASQDDDCLKKFQPYYDLTFLSQPQFWYLDHACVQTPDNPSDKCTYFFSVCHSLPDLPALTSKDVPDVAEVKGTSGSCSGAGACALNKNNDTYRSIGDYNLSILLPLPDYPQFQVNYYTTLQCGSFLVFECNESVSWENSGEGASRRVPDNAILEVAGTHGDCMHLFRFAYDGACVTKSSKTDSTTFGPGTIIVLTIAGLIVIYLLLGTLFNLARGRRGQAALPNGEFWTKTANDIGIGLRFLMSGCRGRPKGKAGALLDSTTKSYATL